MKKIFACLLIALTSLPACNKMDSTYRDFVVPGGIIYPQKAKTPMAYPGRNRVKISWLKGSDPSIVLAKVFWNNYTDSVAVDIPETGDTVSVMITNLPEQSYSFMIRTYDDKGHVSVPEELITAIYGDQYQASLLNRPVVSAIMDDQGIVTIQWGSADISNGAYAMEVAYVDTLGDSVLRRFNVDQSASELPDYEKGKSFKFRTVYLPDTLGIDTFYTDFAAGQVAEKIDKSGWTATADSYEPTHLLPNGPPEEAIDDDINTYWHVQYPSTTAYPHWFMVDMKRAVRVSIVQLVYRQNVFNSFTDFQIEGSLDSTNWTNYGSFNFETINDPQNFQLPGSPSMRYVKIYATKGANTYAHIGELSIYGY